MSAATRLDPEAGLAPITVDWELGFQEPSTIRALAYWRSLCNGHAMPSRRDLSPRDMRGFLSHVNLVDVVPGTGNVIDYIVSLQGTHARDVFGHLAGRRLREMFPATLEQRWRNSFDLPRVAAAPVRLLTRASTVGKDWLVCEALLAPLGDRSGAVHALFWALAARVTK
ncbi:MAG TPA: PAS domain-containing protein [Rhizomicrobium sp.]|jgi:hypothetical protein